ncbi:MAG: hypothetical protein HYT82_02080 [Candidatus Harrisonbacteria bacterium]|nr:hypothetical protein [Candidatus Harrisonbacteria bacterium]
MQKFLAAIPTLAFVVAFGCIMLGAITFIMGMDKMAILIPVGMLVFAGGSLYERHRLRCVCLEISKRSNKGAGRRLEQERRERNQRQSSEFPEVK